MRGSRIAILILCSALPGSAHVQADWFTYRADNSRTGEQPSVSDLSDPTKVSRLAFKWSFPAGGLPAAAVPFVSVFVDQQHFAYLDSVGAIWDSWYDKPSSGWNLQKINLCVGTCNASDGLTYGPKGVSGPFVSVFVDQQHFAYLDSVGAIWDSWYDKPSSSWNLQKINLCVGTCNANNGQTHGPKGVSGPFVSVFVDQQHFAYRDSAGAIWDSWYDKPSSSWNLQKINLCVGTCNASNGQTHGANAAGDPFVSVFVDQQHFAYRDSAGAIWDSWYDKPSSSWNLQKINLCVGTCNASNGQTHGPNVAGDPSTLGP
jgi:hypothetical protein